MMRLYNVKSPGNQLDKHTIEYLISKYPELKSLLNETNSIAINDKLLLIKYILDKYDSLDRSNVNNSENDILKETVKYKYAKMKNRGE